LYCFVYCIPFFLSRIGEYGLYWSSTISDCAIHKTSRCSAEAALHARQRWLTLQKIAAKISWREAKTVGLKKAAAAAAWATSGVVLSLYEPTTAPWLTAPAARRPIQHRSISDAGGDGANWIEHKQLSLRWAQRRLPVDMTDHAPSETSCLSKNVVGWCLYVRVVN